MKKILLSLLTMIYMTVSSGMAMEIHFCMGERTGTDYYTSSGDTCGRCGMKEKKGGCCSDEQTFIKLSEDHQISSLGCFNHDGFETVLANQTYHTVNEITSVKTSLRTHTFADSGPPLYLVNRVFRI